MSPQLPQKVLVVDDNRDTAMSCARLLKGMGHDVQTAFDGLAALEVARSFKPQAILARHRSAGNERLRSREGIARRRVSGTN